MLYNMDRKAGFTLIELLITITVMVILVTLTVVNLRSNQQHARDEKRKSDVATIAQQLESYYNSGSDPASTYPAGEYPSTDLVATEANVKAALRDLDSKALRAPDVAATAPMSFTVASSATPPTPNVSTYVYLPLTASGTLCQSAGEECRKFTMYYALEGTAGVQKVESKH